MHLSAPNTHCRSFPFPNKYRTCILIGSVSLQIVGSTIHVIGGLDLPYWLGTWFGIYPTWEGVAVQFAAMVFVIGSYYLAEGMRRHKLSSIAREAVQSPPGTQIQLKSVEF